ncbi:hypothetical protein KCP75_23965 [Salmonella enterica subsp. enterica]|nr:hypothetical protein KCP75_23965 [Salmonella enterica subsp. enterica]
MLTLAEKSLWLQLTGSLAVLKPDGNRFLFTERASNILSGSKARICPVTSIYWRQPSRFDPICPYHIQFERRQLHQYDAFWLRKSRCQRSPEHDRSQDDYVDGLTKCVTG